MWVKDVESHGHDCCDCCTGPNRNVLLQAKPVLCKNPSHYCNSHVLLRILHLITVIHMCATTYTAHAMKSERTHSTKFIRKSPMHALFVVFTIVYITHNNYNSVTFSGMPIYHGDPWNW